MRDLAKSMVRFSWAMSLFSARQLAALVGEDEANEEGAEGRVRQALDEVSGKTASVLDDRYHSLYEAGNRMQEEVLDVAFELFDPRKVMRATTRVMERAADAVRDLAGETEEGAAEEPESADAAG